MKQIELAFKLIAGLALLSFAASCATEQASIQSKENMLAACGFKTITPKNSAQQAKLALLQPGHVTMVRNTGKPFTLSRPGQEPCLCRRPQGVSGVRTDARGEPAGSGES